MSVLARTVCFLAGHRFAPTQSRYPSAAFALLLASQAALAAPDSLRTMSPPDTGGFTAGSSEARPRVVGGRPVKHSAWPAYVLVLYRVDDERAQFCGGTVIAPEWVLTAAHCVAGREASRFAVHEQLDDLSQRGEGLPVREIVVHENYRSAFPAMQDIALLRLARRASSPPQRLVPQAAALSLIRDGLPGSIAGFGATEPRRLEDKRGGAVSQRLRQVEVPLVERAACRRSLARTFGRSLDEFVDDTVVCAGDPTGRQDSCSGDSGGPLLIDPGDGKPVQAGIVSWGPGCAQRDTVGVYTSVGAFEPWIRRHVPAASFYQVQGAAPAKQPSSVTEIEAVAGLFGVNSDRVRVTIPEGTRLRAGGLLHVRVDTRVSGTLLVYNVDLVSGNVYQLFPNDYTAGARSGGTAPQIATGSSVTIPGAGDTFQIRLKPPAGPNRIYAFVLSKKVRADDIAGRGRTMQTLPDAPRLFGDLAVRARGVEVEPRESGQGGAGVFSYEILP